MSFIRPVVSYFQKALRLLTEPIEQLPQVEDRRRAVISSTVALVSLLAFIFDRISFGKTPLVALILLAGSYVVSRTKWFRFAITPLLFTLSLPSFLYALTTPNPAIANIFSAFAWLALPLILSSLLYSTRTTVIFSGINGVLLFALPFIRSELDFNIIWVVLCFYALTSLLIILVMVQRNEIEKDRQRELIDNRDRLSKEVRLRELFAEEAQRRADQLVMLNEIGHVVSNLQGLEASLDMIFDQVRQRIQLDTFYVALYDEKTDIVTFPIVVDNGKKWNEQPSTLSESPLITRVVQSGRPFIWNLTDTQAEGLTESNDKRVGDVTRTTLSILISPLFIASHVTGVISTQSYEKNLYNEEHLSLLAAISQQVAIAIENARLFEQTTRRAQQLEILNEIGREISTLSELPTLMETVYRQVAKALSTDLFFIGLYQKDSNEINFPIMYDNGRRWEQAPGKATNGTFSGRVILSRKPLLINEWTDNNKETTTMIVGDKSNVTHSLMFTPMQSGNDVLGVISVQSYRANAYTEEDLTLLSGIANQVAVAIQNTRLLDETRQNAGYLSILNELGRVVSELRDLQDLLEVIYDQVRKHISVDAFFVNIYNPQTGLFTVPMAYDDGIRYQVGAQALTSDAFINDFLHGEPAILLLRTEEEISRPIVEEDMFGDTSRRSASLMAVPVKVGEQVIGAISVQSYTRNAYTRDDLALLIGIGNQVGIAIQNARLLEETQENASYLAVLNELGRVVTELRELPDLLEVIYEQVGKHFSANAFYVGLFDPETNSVSYPIMYDEGKKYLQHPDPLQPESFLYRLMHGGPARLILRTQQEIDQITTQTGMLGNLSRPSASLMIAPLKVGEQVIGVISAQSYSLNAYTPRDLDLLVGIGNQVGVAIQNAQLLEETRQTARHLSILNEVGRAVARIMELPELLELVYEEGRNRFSLDGFFVGLYHPDTHEVSFPVLFDDGRRYEQDREQVTEGSFLNRFLNGEKSILINHNIEELENGSLDHKMLGDKKRLSASIIAAPLISRDRVIGLISAQSYTPNAYNETDIRLLEGIANQVAIAIENSRLYASAQQEIKERLRVEMELQRERDFAVQVMNTLGQGVAVSRLGGVYEYVNPAYAAMLGYVPEEMTGILSDDFVHPDDLERLNTETSRRYEGESTTYELRLLHKDGHIVHALITGVPQYANGRIIGAIAAVTDLTERKQTEIERETLLKQMEAKNAELERFTYTVSHDLKSPLVTIAGFLGYLESDLQNGQFDKTSRSLNRIRDAAKKMQRLLDELLELSRIGRIVNPPVDVPFGELVSETLELVEGQLREKQVEVMVEAQFPVVHVDRVRMVEVIQNLVTNAIKFMGQQTSPCIEISWYLENGQPVFLVRDNGTGIAPQYHDRIFGLFNKLDPQSDGTGIGLALVKRIIEVHGGKIWVQSEPGEGATFFFTLGESTKQETV